MENSYLKVYLQIIIVVRHREALLHKSWRADLFKYTSATLTNRGHFALAVNGYNDHVHMFIHYSTKELISDLVREIKKSMSNFIRSNQYTKKKFAWQSGYAVFSHGWRERDIIINYIKNQESHHKKRNFKKEYLQLLEKYEIEFKKEYLFDFFQETNPTE